MRIGADCFLLIDGYLFIISSSEVAMECNSNVKCGKYNGKTMFKECLTTHMGYYVYMDVNTCNMSCIT